MHTGSRMREKDKAVKREQLGLQEPTLQQGEDAKVKVSPEMLRDPLSTWREAKNEQQAWDGPCKWQDEDVSVFLIKV